MHLLMFVVWNSFALHSIVLQTEGHKLYLMLVIVNQEYFQKNIFLISNWLAKLMCLTVCFLGLKQGGILISSPPILILPINLMLI